MHIEFVSTDRFVNNNEPPFPPPLVINAESTSAPFIEANTVESSLDQIKDDHIIPVFIKDNETVISHFEFIETMQEAVMKAFPMERALAPNIRLSHPIKGRVPEARNKPAIELFAH